MTYVVTAVLALSCDIALGFTSSSTGVSTPSVEAGVRVSASTSVSTSALSALKVGKSYTPKWTKKKTLAEEVEAGLGLEGDVPVLFKQADEERKTLAIVGQPLSAVAAQAGQPIRYGCKKGECGTCQVKCNGEWVRPCVAKIPSVAPGESYVLEVRAVKNKSTSSGKFFSVRSFIMGFVNNLVGMVGFVKQRRAAKKNWQERQDIEDRIAKLAEEKRKAMASNDSVNG